MLLYDLRHPRTHVELCWQVNSTAFINEEVRKNEEMRKENVKHTFHNVCVFEQFKIQIQIVFFYCNNDPHVVTYG